MLYLGLLILHILICLILLFLIRTEVLKVHRYMFFVALFLPFWGILVLLVLHFKIVFEPEGSREIGVEKLKLESELYRSVTVDEKKVAATTVPIEEALLINSAHDRRSIIMDVLNDDPKQYIEFLQKAGNNDDTEVVHYAVTAMVEISKENDYLLQSFEKRYSADPDDSELLIEYSDFLWDCLSQNLMQGQVEVMNRELYSTLMNKRLSVSEGSIDDYMNLAGNELKLGRFTEAGAVIEKMGTLFPTSEEYYQTKLNYLASLERGDEIRALIDELKGKRIFLSSKMKEVLAFWEK